MKSWGFMKVTSSDLDKEILTSVVFQCRGRGASPEVSQPGSDTVGGCVYLLLHGLSGPVININCMQDTAPGTIENTEPQLGGGGTQL